MPRLIAMLDGRPTALGEIAAPAKAAEARAGDGVDTNLSNIIETTAQRTPTTDVTAPPRAGPVGKAVGGVVPQF